MTKSITRKPFIYFEALERWDVVVITAYFIITAGVILLSSLSDGETKRLIWFAYSFSPQLLLYLFLYQSLRNFASYLAWFCFGIAHWIIFFIFKDDVELTMVHGTALSGLLNTIPLLMLFQLLRYLSFAIQHREFVAPSRGSTTDLFENKKITLADYTIFIIYISACAGLFIIETHYQY